MGKVLPMSRIVFSFWMFLAVTAFFGTLFPKNAFAQDIVKVGKGSYFHGLPPGKVGPSGPAGRALAPRTLKNDNAPSSPVPSSQYWSSLVFPRMAGNVFGSLVYLPPLSLKVVKEGIEIGCSSSKPSIDTEYHYHHSPLMLIGAEAAGIAVSSWSETGAEVHVLGNAGETIFVFSFQKSSPVISFGGFEGKRLKISLKRNPEFIEKRENAVGCLIGARPFGFFLAKGSLRKENGNVFQTIGEAGANFSVSLLPDVKKATFAEAAGLRSPKL